jgi:rod shape-determining protein MreD
MHRFTFANIRFDLLLLLASYIAIHANTRGAFWGTAALGILRDFGSTARPGSSAIALVLSTWAIMTIREDLRDYGTAGEVALAFLFLLLAGVFYGIPVMFKFGPGVTGHQIYQALGQATATSLLSPFLFALFDIAGVIKKKVTVF